MVYQARAIYEVKKYLRIFAASKLGNSDIEAGSRSCAERFSFG
jgi:hypothetical protein